MPGSKSPSEERGDDFGLVRHRLYRTAAQSPAAWLAYRLLGLVRMDGQPEPQVHNLHVRLREAAEEVEALRHEAADLAADLRNQLQALTLEREALRRLDGNRQERIERRSSP